MTSFPIDKKTNKHQGHLLRSWTSLQISENLPSPKTQLRTVLCLEDTGEVNRNVHGEEGSELDYSEGRSKDFLGGIKLPRLSLDGWVEQNDRKASRLYIDSQ